MINHFNFFRNDNSVTSFTIPNNDSFVGQLGVVYTGNANSERNASSVPTPPGDFIRHAKWPMRNGRAIYYKVITPNDLGRTVSLTGGSTWAGMFFVVDANPHFQMDYANSDILVRVRQTDRPTLAVCVGSGGATLHGFATYSSANYWHHVYTREFPSGFSAGTIAPPTTASWHNTLNPVMLFQQRDNMASAGSIIFLPSHQDALNTGTIRNWTVPKSDWYHFDVVGAVGGGGGFTHWNGGRGSRMRGDFFLSKGTVLKILVGHAGRNSQHDPGDAGGGGGTFVTLSDNTPLIVAGGGGGAYPANFVIGQDAVLTTTGGAGTGSGGGAGGANGNGGIQGSHSGAGGGLTGNGADSSTWYSLARGGTSFINGGNGALDAYSHSQGGFGGGGSGHGY